MNGTKSKRTYRLKDGMVLTVYRRSPGYRESGVYVHRYSLTLYTETNRWLMTVSEDSAERLIGHARRIIAPHRARRYAGMSS